MKKIFKVLLVISLFLFMSKISADTVSNDYTLDNSDELVSISMDHMSCSQLLGVNLTKVVHTFITGIRIFGAIACIVKAMEVILPAVRKKDADALKKAGSTCVTLAIVLCVIGILPALVTLIGKIGGFDLSCL